MARYFEGRAAPAVWLGSCYRNHTGPQCTWSGTECVPAGWPSAVTTAACNTSGAPLEGPRCPEISRQAQYLRTFEIYCTSEQTTTRTAVVLVLVLVQACPGRERCTWCTLLPAVCTLPLPKKETGPLAHRHTRTHSRAHRHMHTHAHPTHIILHRWDTFWVSRLDPHTTTTTACAHSRSRSTCCSRFDCNSTRCGAVFCVLCAV